MQLELHARPLQLQLQAGILQANSLLHLGESIQEHQSQHSVGCNAAEETGQSKHSMA